MNRILKRDIEEISSSNMIDWNNIDNHSFFITGATGLIGSLLVKTFIERNKTKQANIKMFLLVRNKEKAESILGTEENVYYLENNVESCIDNIKVDYIIHGASPTHSKFFTNNPVETLDASILGTKNMLELAKLSKIKSMVYLSSMEMYGTMNDENVTEDKIGKIDILNTRSSYPEGKRASELYCYSYYKEYGVPVKICRIAQTFGPGIHKNENRVFKYFVDCIINKEDIILKSTGKTKINYSYTTDTILGLLCVLSAGKDGEAYNIVGEPTNMNILESAKWLMSEYGDKNNKVICECNEKTEFAPDNEMILNNEKLKRLGWNSKFSLKEGYKRLIEYIQEECKNQQKNELLSGGQNEQTKKN